MRVVLAVDAIAPNLSGVGRYTLELVRRLARSTRVSSLVFYRGGEWTADPARLQMAVETETPPRRSRAPKFVRDYMDRRVLRGGLFHGCNFFLPDFVDRGVITVHDLSVFLYPELHPKDRRRQFERRFARSIERAAHIITHSCTVRDEVIKFTAFDPARVVAIPLAASGDFTPQSPDRLAPALAEYGLAPGGYGLCVSTIDPRKKLLALVEAWGRLPRSLRERTPLAIVGGQGWLSEEVNAAMSRGTAEGWVRQLGYVSQAALPGLYAGAALFAYPSIYEGFGLPPIEAMACGLPVIVSNRSCLPEVTRGAAMMIDPDDGEAFTLGLERGLTDAPWRSSAVARGLEVAAGYSWDRCAEETTDVYRMALSHGVRVH